MTVIPLVPKDRSKRPSGVRRNAMIWLSQQLRGKTVSTTTEPSGRPSSAYGASRL